MSAPHTPTDTQALPAGRELDALVAEKVMGWAPGADFAAATYWSFSTNIADAWHIVERMREQQRMVSLNWLPDSGEWFASIYPPPGEFGLPFDGYGDTAPLALSRAALAAVGGAGRNDGT